MGTTKKWLHSKCMSDHNNYWLHGYFMSVHIIGEKLIIQNLHVIESEITKNSWLNELTGK